MWANNDGCAGLKDGVSMLLHGAREYLWVSEQIINWANDIQKLITADDAVSLEVVQSERPVQFVGHTVTVQQRQA